MKTVYLSSFCVSFRDYARLRRIADGGDGIGVELATSWNYPEFDALLDAQTETFAGVPTTLHAPFVELCNEPGTAEEKFAQAALEKAFRWYDAFDATSMVIHTHEKKVTDAAHMIDTSRAAIMAIAKTAGERDVHLTVENVGYPAKNNALFTQDAFVQFVLDLPEELGALIDTGHAMANHWDIPELIKTLGKRIRGYHLHNTDGIHDLHRPIFEQNLWYDRSKMENLLETAAEYSPDADLILEYAPGEHITPELLHGDVKHIQNIWR